MLLEKLGAMEWYQPCHSDAQRFVDALHGRRQAEALEALLPYASCRVPKDLSLVLLTGERGLGFMRHSITFPWLHSSVDGSPPPAVGCVLPLTVLSLVNALSKR